MKKLAILALCAPAFAGTPEVVVTPAPTPAPAACPCSIEIAGGYNYGCRDLYKHSTGSQKDIDTGSVDLTAVHALNTNHALTLRFGYSFGDEVNKAYQPLFRQETDVHTFTLMPGYRYTHAITDKVSAFAGANVGIANESVKDNLRGYIGRHSDHDSAWGLGYSAEVGLRYAICPKSEIFAAYQFSGNTAHPFGKGETHRQFYDGVRAGVSIKF